MQVQVLGWAARTDGPICKHKAAQRVWLGQALGCGEGSLAVWKEYRRRAGAHRHSALFWAEPTPSRRNRAPSPRMMLHTTQRALLGAGAQPSSRLAGTPPCALRSSAPRALQQQQQQHHQHLQQQRQGAALRREQRRLCRSAAMDPSACVRACVRVRASALCCCLQPATGGGGATTLGPR